MKTRDRRPFLRRPFELALHQDGVTSRSWHTLRHTAASRRVMAGVELLTVKEIVEHRKIQTAMHVSHLI